MTSRLFALLVLAAATRAAAQPVINAAPLPPELDLKAAIVYALDHNYPILQAREQIRQQDGVVLQVKAQLIPNVSATGQYQRNSQGISETFPPSNSNWFVQVKATQLIFAGGGAAAAVKNARLVRDSSLSALQTTINAALLDVRTRYYTVLLNREKVKVQEENIDLFRRQLKDTENQFHAGTLSNFDVLRARVALANAQPDLITARNDARLAIEQLRQSLGVPTGPNAPAVFPDVVGDLTAAPQPVDLDAALASAREHRPELSQLAKLQEASEQGVTIARANYYPNLSAFGGYQWDGFGFSSGGSETANGWQLGLQSSWSIFDGRATQGRVAQARSVLEQARLSLATQDLAIEVAVRQAVSTLQEASELIEATRQTVEQAEEALRLASERFHVGSATQLDVQTSQVALTQARTNQLQSNFNYLVAVAAVRQAEGLTDAVVTN
jgi:outer membrane protein